MYTSRFELDLLNKMFKLRDHNIEYDIGDLWESKQPSKEFHGVKYLNTGSRLFVELEGHCLLLV